MSNTTLFFLTGVVVLCVAALLFLNVFPMFWMPREEKYIKYNDVRGIAVEHKQKLFTLSFDQQNGVIGFLNQSSFVPDSASKDKNPKLEISKIVIYRFGLPDINIVPIEYNNHNLIFSAPDWNPKGLMQDSSHGALENLLLQTYDP
jgi:hypothetical protein